MAVAFDNVAEFAQWTSASPVSIEFTPVGVARAMVVGVAHNEAAGQQITAVSVEGVAMTFMGLEAVGVEPGTVYLWFLGAGIPAGTVTVQITTTGTAGTKWASVVSYTAAGDCTMPVTAHVAGATTPQITLDSGADTSLRASIIFCAVDGLASIVELPVMSASVAAAEHDFGTTTAKFGREAAPAAGSVVIGYSTAGGQSMAIFGGAIVESAPAVPTAPSNLVATALSATSVGLTWDDNSSDETSFRVERSLTGVGGWSTAGTPAANAESFTDTGRTCGAQYFYRVFAVNAAGDSTASNTDDATTSACPPSPTGGNRMGGTGAIRKPPRR